MKDVITIVDKKANSEELNLDLTYIKTLVQKNMKEFKVFKDEQDAVNEALCSENCVSRFLWKNG